LVNSEIFRLFLDEKKRAKFAQPTSAFITFKFANGAKRAREILKDGRLDKAKDDDFKTMS
jgi:hypothetical protein